MAHVVAAFAASHAPMMIAAREAAPEDQRNTFLGALTSAAGQLRQRGAEAVVICSNEHFTNFFLHNFPQFCVGVADPYLGPIEPWLGIDQGWLPGEERLGEHVLKGLIANGFEPSFSQELRLDHGIMTIYHAIDPDMRLPLVPIIQNCAVPDAIAETVL